jgi:hypothetical protein
MQWTFFSRRKGSQLLGVSAFMNSAKDSGAEHRYRYHRNTNGWLVGLVFGPNMSCLAVCLLVCLFVCLAKEPQPGVMAVSLTDATRLRRGMTPRPKCVEHNRPI